VNGSSINRRRFERFALPAMYTPVTARRFADDRHELEGHAYDVSEGGVQFELDEPIAAGTPLNLQITLPASHFDEADPEGPRSIFAVASVVWSDASEPGPVRIAAAFTKFARPGDRERLLRQISSGRLSRAA